MSKGNSGHFKGTNGTSSQLIQELKDNKIKFSEKDIKFITKDKTGQTVWLESGNSGAGLEHIISRHEKDFQFKHGISKSELPNHLNQIFSNGKVEYSRITQRAGRSGYEKLYSYNGKYYLLSGVGSNGYIVSAYPLSTTEAIKLIRRYEKMNNEPETIKIMLEFLQGPIWFSDVETGEPDTGIAVIDSDKEIKELNYKCAELFNSYYEFDSHDQACWFNYEKEKADKEIMLDLITRLVSRLNEINDGSYVIEDLETPRLKQQ